MIDVSKILQTDVIDIIFEGRNKSYGAYELRTNYTRRLFMSVTYMIFGCGLLILLYSFAGANGNRNAQLQIETDVFIEPVKPDEDEPVVIEPPKPKPLEQVRTEIFTPPVITPNDVRPEEMPPEMDVLENAKIGTVKVDGDDFDGTVSPPSVATDKGIIEAPQKKEVEPEIHLSVQIESAYPEGLQAWLRYLNKNLRYPEDAVEKEIQGPVVVQFVVDTEGVVSNVEALSGPKELWAEAIRVIKKSGKWTPAIQNGRQVKSYKRQPIIFQLETE